MYNPLQDIQHYNKTLTISQVVKFFEKKGLGLTRAMIQNYIRDGLLPPPVDKRKYTHAHLAALVMIDYLKSVFDIADIKKALAPLMTDEGLPLETYEAFIGRLEALSGHWKECMSGLFFGTVQPGSEFESELEPESEPESKPEPESETLPLSLLLLMAHAADLKLLSGTLLERKASSD